MILSRPYMYCIIYIYVYIYIVIIITIIIYWYTIYRKCWTRLRAFFGTIPLSYLLCWGRPGYVGHESLPSDTLHLSSSVLKKPCIIHCNTVYNIIPVGICLLTWIPFFLLSKESLPRMPEGLIPSQTHDPGNQLQETQKNTNTKAILQRSAGPC